MRLIDADALLPMMKYATTDSEIGVFPIKIGFNEIARVIDDASTVDAEPVRHSKWKEHKDYPALAYLCSDCGYFTTYRSYYCPYCGARMDEEY